MAFLKVASFTSEVFGQEVDAGSFTGFQAMFGYSETTEVLGSELVTEILSFSFMALLTFLLPLVGAGLSLVNNKIVKIVGAALMLVGAVLMFFMPSFVVFAEEVTLTGALGVGAILGGVFSALGGLVAGYVALTSKK